MSRKTIIPQTISGFVEYIRNAYDVTMKNINIYKIDAVEFAKITPLYTAFINLEALCANPATATKGNRDARNAAWKALEKQWRIFLNKTIRLNDNISVADREIYGIFPHDSTPTAAGIPAECCEITVSRKGYCEYDVIVENGTTGKKKRPDNAAGNNLYSAVVELGQPAPPRETFRFEGFSSTCHHEVRFGEKYLAKQACLFARYTNPHGKEGPEGPVMSFIIV
ncbi:MAG: hypothetical protein LBJ47_08530 [Tannerella sp.]|jgi:hypothetical protein|nr:hypothetical protein [Tannerella sp.]